MAVDEWPLWPTKPMLAQIAARAFSNPGWLFEVKWDGVRCLVHLSSGKVRLQSRGLRDVTKTYPEFAEAPASIRARSAVVDGEIVALDANGIPSFKLLQGRINLVSQSEIKSHAERVPATFYAFDLLYLDGRILMGERLEERKRILKEILKESSRFKYSDHVEGDGEAWFLAAKEKGIEGVIAKKKGSLYEPGERSAQWLKIRIERRDDFVIGGWTPGKRGRSRSFGALLLGQYEAGRLRYAGKVGTGFDGRQLAGIRRSLGDLATEVRPFVEDPGEPGARWAQPRMVCDVRFSERLEGAIRFPVFMGLRPDKEASDVILPTGPPVEPPERAAGWGRVSLTNPDKIFWPGTRYTKGDLFDYYMRIAEAILPHLRNRPLTLYRQPDGIMGESFFQRNRPAFAPGWIESKQIDGDQHTLIDSILCQDVETLAWLANMGCIELHPWLSRWDQPDRPDFVIFDIDPVSPAEYRDACGVALVLRDALSEAGFRTYVKTSGKRGLHLYLPIKSELTYDQTRSFAAQVGEHLASKLGDAFTMSRKAEDKKGRVFFDPAQNGWGRTLAAAYSLRSTQAATVSTPITWDECESCIDPKNFDIRSIPERLRTTEDPWRRMARDAQGVHSILRSRGST